jgi:hypothetical protein
MADPSKASIGKKAIARCMPRFARSLRSATAAGEVITHGAVLDN